MNIQQVINQLEDLQGHCQDFVDKEDDCIWEKDVRALDVAIKILKDIPFSVSTGDWEG